MPKIILEAEKKPTVFLSANNKDDSWRLTEVLVAIIESYLHEGDVHTISSTKTRDIAGDLEELDIAFSRASELTSYFSFIEVRDRSGKVGRNYVQEIIGKRSTVDISKCSIVSTTGFTRNAKRLAATEKVTIPLRLLSTTSDEPSWYASDSMHVQRNLWRIKKCVAQVSVGDNYYDFETDADEAIDKKVLLATDNPDEFLGVPIFKVFEVEALRHPLADEKLFEQIPVDGKWHEVLPTAVFFNTPKFYLRTDKYHEINAPEPFIPIHAIRFFIEICKLSTEGQVSKRCNYVDAMNGEILAQLALASFLIDENQFYLCLVRCKFDENNCRVGGVFFE